MPTLNLLLGPTLGVKEAAKLLSKNPNYATDATSRVLSVPVLGIPLGWVALRLMLMEYHTVALSFLGFMVSLYLFYSWEATEWMGRYIVPYLDKGRHDMSIAKSTSVSDSCASYVFLSSIGAILLRSNQFISVTVGFVVMVTLVRYCESRKFSYVAGGLLTYNPGRKNGNLA
ncbi:hypothetical protein GE061_019002 [Apolygus lucorum]|uniref:Uncharacterized protein n=1 Tax=Apolygus lucorum TaxID=248454 RepID=A0A6A4JWW5_APOLU|nr:hypothetical protein GE061_019002 [Apolygus lucorum]